MSGSMGPGTRFVLPIQTLVDPTGVPIAGGQVFFYATGTSTFQTTYNDVALTVPNPNPIIADSAGRLGNIFMMLAPPYRVRVTDAAGGIIYDVDPVGIGAGTVPGGVPVGSLMAFTSTAAPPGWLICDGSAVSRATFSVLFGVIGTVFGSGDGATTFNVPDLRGRVPAGMDTMGGVAANRLTSGGSGVNGAGIGNSGGSELMMAHNHEITDPGHSHLDSGHEHTLLDVSPIFPYSGGDIDVAGGSAYSTVRSHNVTGIGAASIQNSTTGIYIDWTGTGASQNVQPTLVTTWIIFAGG